MVRSAVDTQRPSVLGKKLTCERKVKSISERVCPVPWIICIALSRGACASGKRSFDGSVFCHCIHSLV